MANKHGLKGSVVKAQAKARRLSKNVKKTTYQVFIGSENGQTRSNQSFKKRKHYLENKQNWPKKKLISKSFPTLLEAGIVDERGFFKKGKKKNFHTKSMVDQKGLDFYGMPRGK
ncbi:hypothetical protein KBB89_01460 [Candidatus Gracilibacteria bacterium]|nr:hypothetical protein [Candidatus Gracilibacteria bacterium]